MDLNLMKAWKAVEIQLPKNELNLLDSCLFRVLSIVRIPPE